MKKLDCIMLIDDDEDDNFLHQNVTREADITDKIVVAENGFEALNILGRMAIAPDLIFLDINMPKMNGWEFIQEYSKLSPERKQKTVIVILTTSMNPADVERSRKLPHVALFKTKPLKTEMLREIYSLYFSEVKENYQD